MCEHNNHRRQFLVGALATGSLAALPGLVSAAGTRQISELQGRVTVNGRTANQHTPIRPGDVVKTGRNSKVVFVVGQDAVMLRSNSRLIIQSHNRIVSGLRLLTGAMMAVFAPGNKTISTPTVTAGIRGTGIYVEARPEESYFCTCYGAVQLNDADNSQAGELVKASHHAARVVKNGQAIQPAGLENHADAELEMLESLVGRSVPF